MGTCDEHEGLTTVYHNENQENHFRQDRSAAPPLTETYFQANIKSLSAALIDSFRATELLSFSSTDFDTRYSVTKSSTRLGFALGWMQIDHHDENAIEPVVLSPTPVHNPQPTIQILAVKDNLRSKSNIDSYEHIAVALEELDFRIEEAWIFDVWQFFVRSLKSRIAKRKAKLRSSAGKVKFTNALENNSSFAGFSDSPLCTEDSNEILSYLKEIHTKAPLHSNDLTTKKIYVEKLMIGFLKVNISYIKSFKGTREVLQDESGNIFMVDNGNSVDAIKGDSNKNDPRAHQGYQEIFRRWSELGHDEDWTVDDAQISQNLPDIISTILFSSISDAPVRIQGKVIDNIFETWSDILLNLKNFYVKEMLFQIYKIIGTFEFVGNPIMVVNSFMKGARDFVVQPFREFLRSPKNPSRFGIGIAKGTLSLLSNFFNCIFGFMSNVSFQHFIFIFFYFFVKCNALISL